MGEAKRRAEARAAGAATDKGFDDYRTMYRGANKKADDRDIGEGWMRGQAAEVNGFNFIIIHPDGVVPPKADESDIILSASYLTQSFKARVRPEYMKDVIDTWPTFWNFFRVNKHLYPDGPDCKDIRHDARQFMFDVILANSHWDSKTAAVTAGAIAWLATTSGVGELWRLGKYKKLHYEITEMGFSPDGRRGRNYRLMMS